MIKKLRLSSYIAFTIAISIAATYLVIASRTDNELFKLLSTFIAVPIFLESAKWVLKDIINIYDTSYLAKEAKTLYETGVINKCEFDYRMNEIIALEEKRIKRIHKNECDNKYLKSEENKSIEDK